MALLISGWHTQQTIWPMLRMRQTLPVTDALMPNRLRKNH